MTTFTASVENLADCLPEFGALLQETLRDVVIDAEGQPSAVPTDLNADAYTAASEAGLVSFVALRDLDGSLVGAVVTMVHPQLHHRTVLAGVTDCFMLTEKAQAHDGAETLYATVKADLERRGVTRWFLGEHAGMPCPVSLHDNGFHPVTTYHALSMGVA